MHNWINQYILILGGTLKIYKTINDDFELIIVYTSSVHGIK